MPEVLTNRIRKFPECLICIFVISWTLPIYALHLWTNYEIVYGRRTLPLGMFFTAVTSDLTTATRCILKDICSCYRSGNIPQDSILRPYRVSLYWGANRDTSDEATAQQQHLHADGYTQPWRCCCKRLSSQFVVRHILAAINGCSEPYLPEDGGDMFSKTSALTRVSHYLSKNTFVVVNMRFVSGFIPSLVLTHI
jgi:hypothetical protein